MRDKFALKKKTFREIVLEGQKEMDIATAQLPIFVNLSKRAVTIGDVAIEMFPMHIVLYTAFLRLKTVYCKYKDKSYCFDCTGCFQSVAELSDKTAVERMSTDYMEIYGGDIYRRERLLDKWKDGMDTAIIRQNITKINSTIRKHLEDETFHPYYMISSLKRYASSRYGVRVEKEKIMIE